MTLKIVTHRQQTRGDFMLGTILIIILILILIGSLPTWGRTRGYGMSGIVGTILIIVIILWLLGHI